jgi:hypothetical protein
MVRLLAVIRGGLVFYPVFSKRHWGVVFTKDMDGLMSGGCRPPGHAMKQNCRPIITLPFKFLSFHLFFIFQISKPSSNKTPSFKEAVYRSRIGENFRCPEGRLSYRSVETTGTGGGIILTSSSSYFLNHPSTRKRPRLEPPAACLCITDPRFPIPNDHENPSNGSGSSLKRGGCSLHAPK